MTDNPVTVDMKGLLVSNGVGVFGSYPSGWSIFIGKEPDEPHKTITFYDMPGDTPNPKYLLDYPRFQLRVRSDNYLEAQAKAEEAKEVLLGWPSQNIGTVRYIGIYIVFDTFFLKADERGRSIFCSSWRIIRELSPDTSGNRQPL